jgi:hypothetical protein
MHLSIEEISNWVFESEDNQSIIYALGQEEALRVGQLIILDKFAIVSSAITDRLAELKDPNQEVERLINKIGELSIISQNRYFSLLEDKPISRDDLIATSVTDRFRTRTSSRIWETLSSEYRRYTNNIPRINERFSDQKRPHERLSFLEGLFINENQISEKVLRKLILSGQIEDVKGIGKRSISLLRDRFISGEGIDNN